MKKIYKVASYKGGDYVSAYHKELPPGLVSVYRLGEWTIASKGFLVGCDDLRIARDISISVSCWNGVADVFILEGLADCWFRAANVHFNFTAGINWDVTYKYRNTQEKIDGFSVMPATGWIFAKSIKTTKLIRRVNCSVYG